MKITIFAVILFVSLAGLSQEKNFLRMSDEEIASHDKATWGTGIMQSKDDSAEYAALRASMKALDKILEKAGNEEVLKFPNRDSTLKDLLEQIQKPMVTNKKRAESPPESFTGNEPVKGEDYGARGKKALDSLSIMLYRLDRKSRWKIMELVDYADTMKLPQRFANWNTIVDRLEVWQHTKALAGFDSAFGKFMGLVREMERNGARDIEGTELLMASGLGKFADDQCRKEAFFDRDLRTIDNYLYQMREGAFSAHKRYLEEFRGKYDDALATLRADWENFKAHGLNLHPKDREMVESLFRSFEHFMVKAGEYMDATGELFKRVEDSGSETYKLRRLAGFMSNDSFLASGSVKDDGAQGYSRRVRVALEDCKAAYVKALDRIFSRSGGTNPGWR